MDSRSRPRTKAGLNPERQAADLNTRLAKKEDSRLIYYYASGWSPATDGRHRGATTVIKQGARVFPLPTQGDSILTHKYGLEEINLTSIQSEEVP